MEVSQQVAIAQLAEGHLWRFEVQEHQFWAVVTVLEALGYISDVSAAHLQDDMEHVFTKVKEKAQEACLK